MKSKVIKRQQKTLVVMKTKLKSIVPFELILSQIPRAGNCYRMTDELSRSNELLYAFLERSRQLKPVQKNILQGRQHFCRSGPNKFLQGGHNTGCKFLGYVEILHTNKWTKKFQP